MNFDNLQILKGARLISATRAGATVSLGFNKNELTFAMHIECFVRLIKNSMLYATSEDMLYPNYTPDTWDDFDWEHFFHIVRYEAIGINLYDLRMKELFKDQSFSVIDVIIDPIGNITFLFEQNLIMQIFINSTIPDENWYFFCENKSDALPLLHDGIVHYYE